LYDPAIDRARSLFFSWAANAIALVVVIAVFDKVTIGSLGDLILAALLFGILNTLLKPVLKVITLPLAVVTLRLIWFGVSMLMLQPWVQPGQMLALLSRSHARALCRKSLDSSDPTGQRSTTLPAQG